MIAQQINTLTLPMAQLRNGAQWATPARSKALRLLMVTPRYFPMMGGVENHVYQVARRLAHAGVDITVLTTDPSKKLPAYEKIEGVHIQRVHAWPNDRDYYLAPSIYHMIRQGDWDLMHLQSYHTLVAPLAMLAAQHAQIPYVVTFHGGGHTSQFRNQMRGLQQTLLRPLLARATRLIAVARFEIGYYGSRLHLPKSRFSLIPNGCDLAPGEAAQPANNETLILSVGRLEEYKGHHRLIAALPHVLQQQPDARVRIVGSGPYEAELYKLAQELGVADRVQIGAIPATDRKAMATALGQAKLVTLLSDFETHPIAALEALSLGRPVLVTQSTGLLELAEQGLAQSIPLTSTPTEVAAAILGQIRNPLTPANLNLPTWDDCARELLLLYRSCTVRM